VSAPSPAPVAGRRIIQCSWLGTGAFVVTAVAAAVSPSALETPALVVALVLFGLGLFVFAWAFVVAIGRSRQAEIAVASLFFLSGSAPAHVRRQLVGSLAVEVVVALATAAARPFTSLAFGVLVPLYGLALAGLWASRCGSFAPRSLDGSRPGMLGRR
jgi:hypothetical protein